MEEGPETSSSVAGLLPAFGSEFDTVVRNGLVDVAVFWREGEELVGLYSRDEDCDTRL